jgi:hypothetical protein
VGRVFWLFIIGVFAALIVAGCGGSSDSSTGGGDGSSLSKAAFIKKAEAVCEKAVFKRNTTMEAAYQRESGGSEERLDKATEEKVVLETIVPPMEALAKELDRLGAETGNSSQVEPVVTQLEEANAQVKKSPAGALAVKDPYVQVKEAAHSYGLTACTTI